MHGMKTGALFSASLRLPKDLAGIPTREHRAEPSSDSPPTRAGPFRSPTTWRMPNGGGLPTSILYYRAADQARRARPLNDCKQPLRRFAKPGARQHQRSSPASRQEVGRSLQQ